MLLLLVIFALLAHTCSAQVSMSCSTSGNTNSQALKNYPSTIIVTFNNCGTLNFDSTVVASRLNMFSAKDAVDGRRIPLSFTSATGTSITFSLVATAASDLEPRTGMVATVSYVPYFVNISVLSCTTGGELRTPLTCNTTDGSNPVALRAMYSLSTSAAGGIMCIMFSENVTCTHTNSATCFTASNMAISPTPSGTNYFSPLSPNPVTNSSIIYCSTFASGWGTSSRSVTVSGSLTVADSSGNLHSPISGTSIGVTIERPNVLMSTSADKIYDADSNGYIDSCYITFAWPLRLEVFKTTVLDLNLIACSINTTHTPELNYTIISGNPAVGIFFKYNEVSSVAQGSATSPSGIGLFITNIAAGTSYGSWRQRHSTPDASGGTLFMIPWNYTTAITTFSDSISNDMAPGLITKAIAQIALNRIVITASETTSTFSATTGNQAPMIVDMLTGVHHFTTHVSTSGSITNTRSSALTPLNATIFNPNLFVLVIPFSFNVGTGSSEEGQIFHYLPFTREDFTPPLLLAVLLKKSSSSTSLFADQVELQFNEEIVCSRLSLQIIHPELGLLAHSNPCASPYVTSYVATLAPYNCFGLLRPCLSTSVALNVTASNIADTNLNFMASIKNVTVDSATASIVAAVVNPGFSIIEIYFSEDMNQSATYTFSYTGLSFLNLTFVSNTMALLYINGTIPSIGNKLTLASPSFTADLFGVLRLMTRDLNLDSVQDAVQIVFSVPVNISYSCASFGLQVTSKDVIASTSAICGDISVGPSYNRSGTVFYGSDYIELATFQTSQLNYTDAIRPVVLSHRYSNLTTIVFTFSEPLVPVSLATSNFSFTGLHILSVSMNASELTFTFVTRDAGIGNLTTCPNSLRDYSGNVAYCSYSFSIPDSKYPTINSTSSYSIANSIFWNRVRIVFNESMTGLLPSNFYVHSPLDAITVSNVTRIDNATFDVFLSVKGPSHGDTGSILFIDVLGVADSSLNVMPDILNVSVVDRAGPTIVSSGVTGTVYVILFSEEVFGSHEDFEFSSGFGLDEVSIDGRTVIIQGNTSHFSILGMNITDVSGNVAVKNLPLTHASDTPVVVVVPTQSDVDTAWFIAVLVVFGVLAVIVVGLIIYEIYLFAPKGFERI